MNTTIIGESVIGYSHIIHGGVRQDNFCVVDGINEGSKKNHKYRQLPQGTRIIAVADGHGSTSCPYSNEGSKIATKVFCDLMADYAIKYKKNIKELFLMLSNEGENVRIAKRIVGEWEECINSYHLHKGREILYDDNHGVDKEAIWKQYGTTLIGMLITPSFVFAFQLGDGDITHVSKEDVSPMIEGDKMLGVETHSISKPDSWGKVITKVVSLENLSDTPFMYVLSTDGWLNSHTSVGEFHKTCKEYYDMIRDKGSEIVENNLKSWLEETSKLGCGDDITVVFVYFD